ncbi:hypothetical protein ACROYT_G029320 [Oculina patagonica]
MFRSCVLLIAAMASLCGQARADVDIPLPLLSAKIGGNGQVDCFVTGENFIGWFKDGSKITDSSTANIRVESSGNKHTLRLINVQVSYGSNNYECRGSKNKDTIWVYVTFSIDKVDKNQHIRIGQADTIKLGISGFPKPTFTWKKGDKVLNPKSDSRLTLLADGSLRINKVTRSDRGNYTCAVVQSGSEQKAKIEVYAVELPKIKPFDKPRRYLTEGYPATFLCEATGFPAPKYTWLSPDGTKINTIGDVRVNGGNLTFKSVDKSMQKGKYTCEAYIEIEETKEQIGRTSRAVEVVDVLVAPTIDPKQGIPELLKRGDDYKLTCVATGNPTPDVTWKRNGISDPRQQQTKGQSVIEFRNIQVSDGGEWTCEARNSAVDDKEKTIVKTLTKFINIESKPFVDTVATPKEVFSYIGNSNPVRVQCKYGGFPLPFVTMRFGDKLMSNATTVAEVKLITDALKYFGTYKCHAENKFGFANYSVELKLAKPPGAVKNLIGKAKCKSIILEWGRPENDGGMPISKYVLTYGDKSPGKTRNIDGDETSYTISDLKHNTEYSITLRATNPAEWGPTSSVEVKTKEYCAPSRPIIYEPSSTLITKDTFTLKWQRPEETGGDDDITYIVRYRIERAEDKYKGPWKTSETKGLQMEISDLDNREQYKFEVIAKNEGGLSLPDERYIQTNYPGERSSQAGLVSSAFVTISVGAILLLL